MPQTATKYHRNTSYSRHTMGGHSLDWAHQPDTFKTFPELENVDLPLSEGYPPASLWDLTADRPVMTAASPLTLQIWSRVLMLAYGLSARRQAPGGWFYYRTAASAGALYPNEIYLATSQTDDLPSGLYHFQNAAMLLAQLRQGDFQQELQAMAPCTDDALPVASLFITGIFFRSAWKYRDRAWRYVLMDAGHVLQNLLLALHAEGLDTRIQYDFSDQALEHFLGIDADREGVLVCVHVFSGASKEKPVPANIPDLPDSIMAHSRVATREVTWPGLQTAHAQSRTIFPNADHLPDFSNRLGLSDPRWKPLPPAPPLPGEKDYAQSVLSRRSRRNFVPDMLDQPRYVRLLRLLANIEQTARTTEAPGRFPLTLGILTGAIEDVPAGFYLLDASGWQAGRVAEKSLIAAMTDICLGQTWLKHASMHLMCLGHLKDLDHYQGLRGYRYAMISAGRIGQALYLGATALGLGCCGIGAFYDDEARNLLGLNEDSAMLYLIAAGKVKAEREKCI